MQDDYIGVPMSPEKMRNLLVELYSGKRFKRSAAIEKIKEEHINRGGTIKEGYNLVSCFKTAISDLKLRQLVGHPANGWWDIYATPGKCEVEVEVEKPLVLPKSQKMLNSKHIGQGKHEVYVYFYPTYKELAKFKGNQVYPCKIGRSSNGVLNRVITQSGTAMPEYPQIDIVIHTDKPQELEKTIHSILQYDGCLIEDSPGKEWYMIDPTQVVSICRNLGLIEGDY